MAESCFPKERLDKSLIVFLIENKLQILSLLKKKKQKKTILEQVAISFSRGIFPTQELNLGSLHCRRFFTNWATREAWSRHLEIFIYLTKNKGEFQGFILCTKKHISKCAFIYVLEIKSLWWFSAEKVLPYLYVWCY